MSDSVNNLSVSEFSKLFGVTEEEIPTECIDLINKKDFRYSFFSQEDRDSLLLKRFKIIHKKEFTVSGKEEKEKWGIGWEEILNNFIKSGYDKKSLIPQYVRNGYPITLFRDYVKSYDENFENNFVEVLRLFILHKYLKGSNNIYEFGCGTGFNLLAMAEHLPEKNYHGCDWVVQSKKIIDLISDNFKLNINGSVFDMFNPYFRMPIEENSSIFTIGSLEQLGQEYEKFIEFLLSKPFSKYVHINSILEMYDYDNNIVDYLIYKMEIDRNYCNGFFTKLIDLEKNGVIRINKMHRVECGSIMGDGYSITVWEKI